MKFIYLFTLVCLCSCASKLIVNTYDNKTRCIGANVDGVQIVKAWGNGENVDQVIESAKKRAIYDVVFKGILDGGGNCSVRPIVTVLNAEEQYKEFIASFFEKRGKYEDFIKTYGVIQKSKIKKGEGVSFEINITSLKKELLSNKIILSK